MTTRWVGRANDWYAGTCFCWRPASDPAGADDVMINSGEADLNSGRAEFRAASLTQSKSGVLAIDDPGATQAGARNVSNTVPIDLEYGAALSERDALTNDGAGALTYGGCLSIRQFGVATAFDDDREAASHRMNGSLSCLRRGTA